MKASDFFLDREDKALCFKGGVNINQKEAAFRMALLNALDYLDGKIDGSNQSCEKREVLSKFEHRFVEGANLNQGVVQLLSWSHLETVFDKAFGLREGEKLVGVIVNDHGISAVIE